MALQGDDSDDIEGVYGIGAKLAPRFIAAAGSLEALLANPQLAASVPGVCWAQACTIA